MISRMGPGGSKPNIAFLRVVLSGNLTGPPSGGSINTKVFPKSDSETLLLDTDFKTGLIK